MTWIVERCLVAGHLLACSGDAMLGCLVARSNSAGLGCLVACSGDAMLGCLVACSGDAMLVACPDSAGRGCLGRGAGAGGLRVPATRVLPGHVLAAPPVRKNMSL
ncbi:MAG TPA: hypothetical protein VGB85_33160, partial [Nannocystis sp.]